MKAKNFCVWTFDDIDCFYEVPCKETTFMFTDGDELIDGFKFCPYCGLPIKEKKK